MYYKRTLEEPLRAASEQFGVLLLTGPRQVGKTTILMYLCEKHRQYVTLDDPTLRSLAQEDPALFLRRFHPPVLIDEIQYAPQLLPYIKLDVDSNGGNGRFWLTGSQQFHLMKGVTESLAGRAAVINMLGFSGRERRKLSLDVLPFLPDQTVLPRRLGSVPCLTDDEMWNEIWLGSYPALAVGTIRNRDLFYQSYLQTYIERDVRSLAQVGNQIAFLKFLTACAARTAQLLNLSEVARDVDISVPTAKNWLSVLQASMQVFLLRPYHANITSRLIKAPKLYFLDTGLAAYLTEWTSPKTLAAGAMRGAYFETHVFSEILKSWWHCLKSPPLFFYRDKDGKEIDFLFERDGVLYPAEAKLGATPKREWARHFSALRRLGKPVGRGAVICMRPDPCPIDEAADAIPAACI